MRYEGLGRGDAEQSNAYQVETNRTTNVREPNIIVLCIIYKYIDILFAKLA